MGKDQEAYDALKALSEEVQEDPQETDGEVAQDTNAEIEATETVEEEVAEEDAEEPVEDLEDSDDAEQKVPLRRLKKETAKFKQTQEELEKMKAELESLKQAQAKPESNEESNPLAKYSEDQLLQIANQKPEWGSRVLNELRRRDKEELRTEFRQVDAQKEQRQQAEQAALTKFPDLGNKESDLYKEFVRVYQSDPSYAQNPAGVYVAAQNAFVELATSGRLNLAKSNATEKKVLKKREAKMKKRDELEASSRHGSPAQKSEQEFLDLETRAHDAGPRSPEWLEYQKAKEARKNTS